MKQFVFFFCLAVSSVQIFANDTLIFKIANPRLTVRNPGGNYIRKVIHTADSGFLALDYNETGLVAKGYYNDTGFDIKIYTHYFYNTKKGFLQEIKCYDEMGSLTLHAEMNKQGDTIWRQTFKDDIVTGSRIFPENDADRTIFFSMQKPAVYNGGSLAWKKYISSNMKYPKDALASKLEGVVVIEFTVSKEGKINKSKVVQPASSSLNTEAMRLINASAAWLPAEENGNKINSTQRRCIVFKL